MQPVAAWLKKNRDAIGVAATVLQSLAVVGGIVAASYEFILSGKAEERERIRNTIPLVEKAYEADVVRARGEFLKMTYIFMGAQMAGHDAGPGNPDYVDLGKLLEMEQEMSRSLSRLAGVYEMLTQCLSARICSERAAFPALCLDASLLLEDTRKVKAYVEERHARQTRGELSEWFRRDRARLYFPLRGFDEFTKACLAWNDRHPQERVPIAQSGFQGPR